MALTVDLSGKTALVTGAGRGLGQAIALALGAAGARVVALGRSRDGLDETVELLRDQGSDGLAHLADIAEIPRLADHVTAVLAVTGGIDILVNNAGVEQVSPSLEVTEATWDRIVDTNLKATFFLSQAVARHMRARGGGSIVNLASLTSFVGVPTAAPYGASKSGVLGLTRTLAAEWAPFGIRVNAIAPGYFRTDMTKVFYQDAKWQSAMLEKIPAGRFGTLSDVGGAVVFLSSPAAAYVTGQCLGIDGGYLAAI